MKTLTLVSAGLELPDRNTLLRLEAADEFPRVSLFYEVLNSDRLDERFLEQTPRLRRIAYRALPNIAGHLSEALLIKNRYDAVISWTERFGLAFSFLLGPFHSNTPHIAIFSWISGPKKAEVLQRVYHNIDKIILMSSVQSKIAINQLGIPASRIQLLKWGVDQKFWRPMNVPTSVICSVGSERRDYPTLIEAMRDTNIQCHIAAGTQRNVTHSTVKAIWQDGAPPPNVTVGKKNYVELRMLYAQSKFVVIPIFESDTDHGATSILEAMASGKAVICSKTSGQVDIVQEGRTGLLVPNGDPAALRQAIQYLWDNPHIAEQMGREGRKYIETHHTVDEFVNNVKAVVCEAIQQKQPLTAGNNRFRSTKSVKKNEDALVVGGKPTPTSDGTIINPRLKILMAFHLSSYPANFGAAKRNLHLFEETIKHHDVSVLSYGTPMDERLFREAYGKLCKHIIFVDTKPRWLRRVTLLWLFVTGRSSFHLLRSKEFQDALDTLLKKESFDILHLRALLLATHRLPTDIPLIGDMHNVEYDNLHRAYMASKSLLRKLYYGIEYRLTRSTEIALGRKCDALLTTSERDLRVVLEDLPDAKMRLIPNGVDLQFYSAQEATPDPRSLVFTALMNYYPNQHGLLWFLDEVFPQILEKSPSARIFVVGANPSRNILKRETKNVTITGFVDDVRPYVARSQIFVIPLLIGGGTRLKALEAMAMKRPIVSTTLGCEGIHLKHGESVLFGDTPTEFANAVIRLFEDAELRSKLVENAYENVVSHYSWDVIGKDLEQVHQSMVKSNTSTE